MVLLSYNPQSTQYRFSRTHPLRPERFSLAVDLMDAWGLVGEPGPAAEAHCDGPCAVPASPLAATDADLALVHSKAYLANVMAASAPSTFPTEFEGMGIGPGDTPAFEGMHEASALVAGATIEAVERVVRGDFARAFAPAGGLHHAHRARASGFCVYNDVAIAIARATRDHAGLRVAYVDIDAHHGDGVEEAFAERADVLTVSVHESGRYLFPGTGRTTDIGSGAGEGYAINVPLPPYADGECYRLAHDLVIAPALRRFAPDLIVAQIGADTHRADPLTHLYQSVAGFAEAVQRLLDVADEVCRGRIVLTGGGGYRPFSEVPRMWASALALALDRDVPEVLPESWMRVAETAARDAGEEGPRSTATFAEHLPELGGEAKAAAIQVTRFVIDQVREASPLLEPSR